MSGDKKNEPGAEGGRSEAPLRGGGAVSGTLATRAHDEDPWTLALHPPHRCGSSVGGTITAGRTTERSKPKEETDALYRRARLPDALRDPG